MCEGGGAAYPACEVLEIKDGVGAAYPGSVVLEDKLQGGELTGGAEVQTS